ncbi:Putative membrane-associated or secreted trancriptional regulator [Halorhabdus sp. SVX81]|uniref:DUF7345 domain-containing protein n=1 Tax=Halorhabdus sp. SVX81 TaxID=2978283 RepID=UPI0023DBF41E|nr:hypothetical protein [Halorhabdus sp. SVX81]WEL18341.1 Putative membrane-associated or secreted trancriptional regulator [Halorhabdus sp. SVX81]
MRKGTRIVALVVTATLLVASVAPAGAASGEQPTDAVVVDLESDGSATVTIQSTYDLGSDAEQEAFEELRSDEQAREDIRTTFRNRMALVAESAENATGRDMAVADASVDLGVVDNTGVVTLSVTWDGLAAVEDDRLVVDEPFASGFAIDRPVTLQSPENYTLADATPTPDDRENSLQWNAGTDLEGFEVSFERTTGDGTAASGPGFGLIAAILGITALGAVGLRS